MEEVKVKIKYVYDDVKDLYEKGEPSYAHDGDSGMDVYAYIEDRQPIRIHPGATKLIDTGIKVAIPKGYEIQVRSTSGNSLKKNLVVNNSPGTIDSPYRGSCGVILHNEHTRKDIYGKDGVADTLIVNHGDKIAQFVLCPVLKCVWDEVDELDDTSRGEGGYGSTEKVKINDK